MKWGRKQFIILAACLVPVLLFLLINLPFGRNNSFFGAIDNVVQNNSALQVVDFKESAYKMRSALGLGDIVYEKQYDYSSEEIWKTIVLEDGSTKKIINDDFFKNEIFIYSGDVTNYIKGSSVDGQSVEQDDVNSFIDQTLEPGTIVSIPRQDGDYVVVSNEKLSSIIISRLKEQQEPQIITLRKYIFILKQYEKWLDSDDDYLKSQIKTDIIETLQFNTLELEEKNTSGQIKLYAQKVYDLCRSLQSKIDEISEDEE